MSQNQSQTIVERVDELRNRIRSLAGSLPGMRDRLAAAADTAFKHALPVLGRIKERRPPAWPRSRERHGPTSHRPISGAIFQCRALLQRPASASRGIS